MARHQSSSAGTFTTDRDLVVRSWDAWIADATGISESAAIGEPLGRLYPELAERGVLSRLRRIADGGGVDVLASTFHKYLLPCRPRNRESRFEWMRQHVTLAPVRDRDGIAGVTVTIEDVTERLDREKRLAADLDHEDEAVRLSAAQALVAQGEAPALLASALNDESWRVRRVAAEGMASGGGREVVDMLIDALRDHHRDPALLNAALTALGQTRADIVMDLVPLLRHDEADVRTYGALALGLAGDARGVPALVPLLEDDDANVQFHVIEALGRIGDRGAADALTTVAERRDFFLAFAALDALAAIGEGAVAPRLIQLLEDDMLLSATVSCLGAIGAEDVAVPLARLVMGSGAPVPLIALALATVHDRLEREFGEGELIEDLVRATMTASSAEVLVAALSDASDEELRGLIVVLSWLRFDGVDQALASLLHRAAVQALVAERIASRGVSAAPFIEQAAARDASDDVRAAAAFAFGRIGSSDSVPTLLSWLSDEADSQSVIAIAAALGSIGDRRAFAPLLQFLDHPDASVRHAAISALNSIGHPEMEGAVADRFHDASPRIRESVARIAGYFGYDSCLRHMVAMCADSAPEVRRAAVESLAHYDQRIAWSTIYAVVRDDPDSTVRAAAARALGESTQADATPALVQASQDGSVWVRYFAVRSMMRRAIAHADVLAALAECATRDPATPVRIAAIDALADLRANSSLGVVLPLAQDQEEEVATAAIAALGCFDSAATADVLTRALSEDEAKRQHAALDAVSRQRAQHAVPVVRDIARDVVSDETRRHAVETLAAIGGVDAVQVLISLGLDRRMREPVISALAGLSETQVPSLRSGFSDAPAAAREIIIQALGRMKHAAASRTLAYALDDPAPSVRLAAARALSRLDLRDARSQLAALERTDEHLSIRNAAHNALTRG